MGSQTAQSTFEVLLSCQSQSSPSSSAMSGVSPYEDMESCDGFESECKSPSLSSTSAPDIMAMDSPLDTDHSVDAEERMERMMSLSPVAVVDFCRNQIKIPANFDEGKLDPVFDRFGHRGQLNYNEFAQALQCEALPIY